jgi:hypothetical protein
MIMNSQAKTRLLASAIAAALGSGAALATVPNPGGTTITVYAGGGAAESNPLLVAACRVLTNVDGYTDATGGADSGSYRVLYGDVPTGGISNAGGTVAAGTHVLVFYKFNGGTYANGAVPQTSAGGTLPYPSLSAVSSATTISGQTQGSTCSNGGKPTYQYTDTGLVTDEHQPEWGVTDLEVGIFQGIENNPLYPAATVAVQNTSPLYDLVLGVAVTQALYNYKTNFSSAEVAGILDGFYTDWSQLYGDSGAPLPAGGIILIDRNVGSGLKAAGNQYFLGFPGLGANAQTPESVTYGYTGALVTSQVLQDVSDTSTTAQANDLKNANTAGLLAISVLSLDTPPAYNQATSGTNSYDFVKLNGTAVDTGVTGDNINGSTGTSYINAIRGNYDFFYQSNFSYRNGYSGGTPVIDEAILAAFQSATFPGVADGKSFPTAAPGTLVDADRASSLTAGVTINTRGGTSTAILLPKFTGTANGAGIPTGSDPL